MQTILGSTGIIGTELAKALPAFTPHVRLVSRSPKAIIGNEQLMSADLMKAEDADRAVAGSEIVYLTVGLPYDIKVWTRDWPILMGNVIAACKKHHAKLVFFDNVYPYGKVDGWMNEETAFAPSSKKGEARARIDRMVLDAVAKGEIEAILARAADFYGITPLAYTYLLVIQNFAKGKKAQWLVDANTRHTFTHVKDAAYGTALLGNTPDAFNQIWHLPSDMSSPTGKEFIEIAAKEFGVKPAFMTIPKWMMTIMGWFNPMMKEIGEMLYQNEVDYLFDCTKFNSRFDYRAMTYAEGIHDIALDMQAVKAKPVKA